MSVLLPPSRCLLGRAGLGLVVVALGGFLAADLDAQNPDKNAPPKPKRTEEEDDQAPPRKKRAEKEDEATKPGHKVPKVEGDDAPEPQEPARVTVTSEKDLARLAGQARNADLKKLFLELSVAHDEVRFDNKPADNVYPVKKFTGGRINGTLMVQPLDEKGQNRGTRYDAKDTRATGIRYYEELAQDRVDEFLKKGFERRDEKSPEYLSRFSQTVAAEQALTGVLGFHLSARAAGRREGEAWSAIETALKKRILELAISQLEDLAGTGDWARAFARTQELAGRFPHGADQARIARPVADLVNRELKSGLNDAERMRTAREHLARLQEQFPGNPALAPLGDSLSKQAQALYERALELRKDKRNEAYDLARQAEETWPQLPGVHDLVLELSDVKPLSVGVRELPQFLSPALACTDSELRGVELLFESLVQLSPEPGGAVRYRPGLAEGRPRLVPMGRQFDLPHSAFWSDGKKLTGADIRSTVRLLQKGQGTGRGAAWGELLEDVLVTEDPYKVNLTLRQGYLEPLSLMTFKVLPAEKRDEADQESFAKKPVGSGPFRFIGVQSDMKGRSYAQFLANPYFGTRAHTHGLPRIREIRLFPCDNPVKDLQNGDLDLVLDLTAAQAAELRDLGVKAHATVPLPQPATPNRRVYFLAVNHRNPHLQHRELRLALAHAVNREKLLDDFFRGPLGRQVHKAINGPYPAHSWPSNPTLKSRLVKDSLDLYDPDVAKTFAQQAADKIKLKPVRLTLKYPAGDPAKPALEALRDQVREATGVVLDLVERTPWELRREVEEDHNYELAYYHYDFPDDTYWLWPLLGPRGRGGRDNYLGYQGVEVRTLLQEEMGRREFGQVRDLAREVHLDLNREMPLIPLWQLDPLAAVSDALKAPPFDPLLVFTDVEHWKLERK